jgi:hypothetical protein
VNVPRQHDAFDVLAVARRVGHVEIDRHPSDDCRSQDELVVAILVSLDSGRVVRAP